jgi:hypothetical protein
MLQSPLHAIHFKQIVNLANDTGGGPMLLGPQPEPLVAEIIATLRMRYKRLNPHYEAGWTDSWSHRRCMHQHHTLIDAANCAQQNDGVGTSLRLKATHHGN